MFEKKVWAEAAEGEGVYEIENGKSSNLALTAVVG